MRGPFSRKLGAFTRLSEDDETLIDHVMVHRRKIDARDDIVSDRGRVRSLTLVEAGWGCRYRMMEDGRRQIVSLLLPGDVCDFNPLVFDRVEYGMSAITTMDLTDIPVDSFGLLMNANERLRQAIRWVQLVAHEIQREWTVSLGQRTALERVSHLFCEVFYRLRSVGLAADDHCAFPLTQTELGEATGLSTVHVNRTLQELRAEELIVLKDRTLWIPDLGKLERAAAFEPGYLHLDHAGRHLDAN